MASDPNHHTSEKSVAKTAKARVYTADMDENAVVDWLVSAKPGETVAYHTGNLLYFRTKYPELDRSAKRMWAAYEDGLVTLTQRRVTENVIAYLAIRKPKRLAMKKAA